MRVPNPVALLDTLRPGAAGVAPDHLAELILGRRGATAMAGGYDDVRLGNTAAIMEVLFPQLSVDLNG